MSTSRVAFTDVRAIGWRLPVVLGLIVTVDEVLALGALGVAPRGGAPLAMRVLAALVSAAVVSTVLLLGRWTWLRTSVARNRPAVIVATVAIAAPFGVASSRAVLVAGELSEPPPGIGLDASIFLSATTIVVLAVLGVLERHRRLSATLRSRAAQLEVALDRSADAVEAERAALAARVRDLLEDRLGPTTLRPALLTPERLREVANRTLRPLAHQLAQPVDRSDRPPLRPVRPIAALQALRGLRAGPTVRPRILAATMFILTFRFSITTPTERPRPPAPSVPDGPGVTLTVDWTSFAQSIALHVATVTIVLIGASLLARSIARRMPTSPGNIELTRHWAIVLGGLVLLGLVSLALLRVLHALPGLGVLPPVNAAVVVGFTAPLVIVTIVTSILPAAEAALEGLRSEVAATNTDLARATARTNALLDHERRLFARHLHSTVQAAVNAASLIIERDAVDGDVDPNVVERAAELIDAAVERLTGDTTSGAFAERDGIADLDERLAAIVATWEDLATLTVDIDPRAREILSTETVARATTCDLIAEACANAVIHGNARTIRVRVGTDGVGGDAGVLPRELQLDVHDDGDLPDPQRSDGLGSRILTASTTRWTLERDEDGTTLRAALPVR